ncbi:MAG: homocysteine S-methyltransferase family protein [Oscillospiraceae bacterium]|nr:homocysteine S-methyltransferase family protein [Oscillospiraceae bacterium]
MIFSGEFLIFDGAMGTMLQKRGLKPGGLPELLNLTNGDTVRAVHEEYVRAGANVVTANTFGANAYKLAGKASVPEVVSAGVRLARESGAKYVALDVGPTGALFAPMGDLDFDTALGVFGEQIRAGVQAGADLILIETMADLLEAKAALIAAKDVCDLPVFVTMTYEESGRTFLGADPAAATATLCAFGTDAVGINCSLAPGAILPVADTVLKYATVPVIVQANAGMPCTHGGEVYYSVGADEYAKGVAELIAKGVSILGGCCGTTPEYIAKIREMTRGMTPAARGEAVRPVAASAREVVLPGDIVYGYVDVDSAQLAAGRMDDIIDGVMDALDDGPDVLALRLPAAAGAEAVKGLIAEINALTQKPVRVEGAAREVLRAAARCYNGILDVLGRV